MYNRRPSAALHAEESKDGLNDRGNDGSRQGRVEMECDVLIFSTSATHVVRENSSLTKRRRRIWTEDIYNSRVGHTGDTALIPHVMLNTAGITSR